jgi:ABC-type uncharacterized transport system substrate-binding protein
VRLKVDIILVSGGAGLVLGAKNATKTIPIVMAVSSIDPVERGLVESLARPGGNVTGFSSLSRELGGKRLELLKEAVTNLTRVAVLYSIGTPGITRELKEDLPRVARTLKLNVQPWGIRDLDDLEKVFASFTTQHPDGLYAPIAGAVMTANQKRIADFSLKNRLPSMYSNSLAVNDGGLMSYAADESERYRRVAYFIDKILKGAKPADLPVEQPKKFEFIVNLKAAKQIGLTIPPNVLVRADRVIK